MKKIVLFIFFIICAISSFAQTSVKPMTFYANPSALDSIAYTYPGKTSLDWLYRARYIRQILGVTSAKDTLSIKDFIGSGTGADPFRLTTDTTRVGNFIVRYSNGFLGKDTSKYLPQYLHADWQTFTLGHNLLLGENAVNFYIQPGTPAGGIVATNPSTQQTGIIGISSNTSSLEYLDTAGNSSNILATAEHASMISQGHSGHSYSLDLNNESSTTPGAFFTDTYGSVGIHYARKNYTPDDSTLVDKYWVTQHFVSGDTSTLNNIYHNNGTIPASTARLMGLPSSSSFSIGAGSALGGNYATFFQSSDHIQLNVLSAVPTGIKLDGTTAVMYASAGSPTDNPTSIYLSDGNGTTVRDDAGGIGIKGFDDYTPGALTTDLAYLQTKGIKGLIKDSIASHSPGLTSQSLTFINSGSGAPSGTTFNGSSAKTISYNTIGAQPQLSGTGFVKATGTAISYDNSTYVATTDGSYVKSVVLNTPNVLYTTPINFSTSSNTATGTLSLNTQSAYTIFGNNTGSSATPTFFTPILASALFQNQGTTTTILHGNASGNPSWGAVSLTTDVSGVLPMANGGSVYNYRPISAATTITSADQVINITGGSFPQPLPSSLNNYQTIYVVNSGSGSVTLTATSINGNSSVTINPGDSLQLFYTGTSGTYIIL